MSSYEETTKTSHRFGSWRPAVLMAGGLVLLSALVAGILLLLSGSGRSNARDSSALPPEERSLSVAAEASESPGAIAERSPSAAAETSDSPGVVADPAVQAAISRLDALPPCQDPASFAQWMSATPTAHGIESGVDPKYFQSIDLSGAPVMPVPPTNFVPILLDTPPNAACFSVGHLGALAGWEMRSHDGTLIARAMSYPWFVDDPSAEPFLEVEVRANGLPIGLERAGAELSIPIGTGELFEGFVGDGLILGAVDSSRLSGTVHDQLLFMETPGLTELAPEEIVEQLVMTGDDD